VAIRKFEDLDVWQEAVELTGELYNELKDCRIFSLRDQILRSAISIPSNIAEGYERKSNKEFIQHLYIAKGSCSELRTQLYLCAKMEVLGDENVTLFLERSRNLSAMLMKLIQTRNERF
jgi:four helix bundle protein